MPNLNRVLLIGNLTRDPEVRYTPKGTAVAEMSLAINRFTQSDNGEKKEEVTFVDVTLWARLAEISGEYLKKRKPVFVEGRLQFDTWDDKQTGQKKYMTEIVASDLILLGGRGEGGGGDFAGSSRGASASSASNNFDQRAPEHEPAGSGPITDEDIPF